MSTPTFDSRPLTEPVDKARVRAFAQRLREQGRRLGPSRAVMTIFIVVFAFLFAIFLVPTLFTIVAGIGAGGFPLWSAILPLAVPVAVLVILAVALRKTWGGTSAKIRAYRLSHFAQANGMSFDPGMDSPQLPGMIFSLGNSRRSRDLVRGASPRFVEVGNYQYTTGSGKNKTTHHWGYVAVKLDVPLPNIVLDATSNNTLFGSNLPAAFDRHQRLHLEGDFDSHFALYCPSGYEQDALYLFTPDIMARFIDNAAALDVEIVDDWLFLYAQRDLSTLDPAVWSWLFATVRAILGKMDQWSRWRDDRLIAMTDASAHAGGAVGSVTPASIADHPVPAGTSAASSPEALPLAAPTEPLTPPPAGVASGGRRLRTRTVKVPYLIAGAIIVFWVTKFILGLW